MSQLEVKEIRKLYVCQLKVRLSLLFLLIYTDAVQLKGLYHVKCTRLCYIRELVIGMFALIVFHCTLSLKSMWLIADCF